MVIKAVVTGKSVQSKALALCARERACLPGVTPRKSFLATSSPYWTAVTP
jgi:hypothetical protein